MGSIEIPDPVFEIHVESHYPEDSYASPASHYDAEVTCGGVTVFTVQFHHDYARYAAARARGDHAHPDYRYYADDDDHAHEQALAEFGHALKAVFDASHTRHDTDLIG